MPVNLYDLFHKFADHTAGRFRLGAPRKERTRFVMEFLREYLRSGGFEEPQREYMAIDAVWRDPYLGHIALAVEHENTHDIREFINKEVQHLVDVKAEAKVAIAYPHMGEETSALAEITTKIQRAANMTAELSGETYLLVFGANTWQEKKKAIRWKGYVINRLGVMQNQLEKVVPQASR